MLSSTSAERLHGIYQASSADLSLEHYLIWQEAMKRCLREAALSSSIGVLQLASWFKREGFALLVEGQLAANALPSKSIAFDPRTETGLRPYIRSPILGLIGVPELSDVA